jgi:DsbC/DsbD-like thiol-disulfide interchange protein
MNRRRFISCSAVAALLPLVSPVWAEQKPWTMRIVQGLADKDGWLLGLEVVMQPHWKTYWRVPGQGGVPPFLEAKGENVKSNELLCPTPTRFRNADGEAIGYMESAMFLLRVLAVDPGKPIAADVSAFLGVCKDVCIPAQFSTHVMSGDPTSHVDFETLNKWNDLVPTVTKDLVTSATAAMVEGKPAVTFELSRPLLDVFVEGSEMHYFKKPRFDGARATLQVAGAKSLDDIRKTKLRVTGKLNVGGLEQMVTVV